MTVLEIMERVDSKKPSLIKAFVNDALREIGELSQNTVTYSVFDVLSGIRDYSLPSSFGVILGVYGIDDENRYKRISRIQNVDVIEDVSGGSSGGVTTEEIIL